ncbi:MAG: hypothetical protein RLZ28_891 [Actinomycetota bacterium]
MRKLKVIYVENDSALRAMLSSMLDAVEQVNLLGSFATTGEALKAPEVQIADVALVDFALERDGLNGVELGIALRSLNLNIGIAIYSQHEVEPLVTRVPREMRPGWSFFEKSAFMSVEDYVDILNETARGKGNWQDFEHAYSDNRANSLSLLLSLSGRQRAVMDLASAGKSSMEIAKTLDMTYAYVRKELSRIYAVLVPEATAAVDQKTAAVLRYLEIAKSNVDR